MEDLIRRRLLDLAEQADRTDCYTFSAFLNEAELAVFYAMIKELPPCGYTVWGGRENADRAMVRFGRLARLGWEEPFPIVCLEIAPAQKKFADALSHRDFLGALMHLGIQRTELGDIVTDDKTAYLLCTENMADYICRELTQVRHTTVICRRIEAFPAGIGTETEPVQVQAASLRADGVIAKLFHISRNDCLTLFRSGKVFINGAATENSSYQLKEGDKVSVRGSGKFRFCGISGTTRKGNLILTIERFV